jgi:hypothetical protein
MAKQPSLRLLRIEDFPEDDYWGKLIETFNLAAQALMDTLAKGITFDENIDCQIFETTAIAPATGYMSMKIKHTLKNRPKCVIITQCYPAKDPYANVG